MIELIPLKSVFTSLLSDIFLMHVFADAFRVISGYEHGRHVVLDDRN